MDDIELFQSIVIHNLIEVTPEVVEATKFAIERLAIENFDRLYVVIRHGNSQEKREAFKKIASLGDIRKTIKAVEKIGQVPPLWMHDYYTLYTPDELSRIVLLNAISVTDDPELSYYVTKNPEVFAGIDGPTYKTWLSMGRPRMSEAIYNTNNSFDNINDAAIAFAQAYSINFINPAEVIVMYAPHLITKFGILDILLQLGSQITSQEVSNIAIGTQNTEEHIRDLHMRLFGYGKSPTEDVKWINDNAPWLVFTCELVTQNKLMLQYNTFMFVMGQARENKQEALDIIYRLRYMIDPTRARLMLLLLGEELSGQVNDISSCPASTTGIEQEA